MATDLNVINQALQSTQGATSPTQLALLLAQILGTSNDANVATAAANRAASDWEGAATGLQGDQAALRQILAGLVPEVAAPLPNFDEASIIGRADQRYSGLVGSVDRAHALAASQGFAKALRSGMTDSTQAQDQAQSMTRQFSDVYAKLRENAQSTAFQEAIQAYKTALDKRAAGVQGINVATGGLANYGRTLLDNERMRFNSAQQTAGQANKSSGDAWAKILDSSVGKRLLGAVDSKVGAWMGGDKTATPGPSAAGPVTSPTSWGPPQQAEPLSSWFDSYLAQPDNQPAEQAGPPTEDEFSNWQLPASLNQYEVSPTYEYDAYDYQQQPEPEPQQEPAWEGGWDDNDWGW
jgi:hypothetical protein